MIPMPTETLQSNTEVIDGFIVDTETGEVLGFVEQPTEFLVTDEDSCNWVLKKMLKVEADIMSIDNSADVLAADAVLRNATALRRVKEKRLEYLHKRFDAELGEYARGQLQGKKERTFKTIFGAIALRFVKGGLRVADKTLALRWATTAAPDAIKVTEEFQISQLSAAQKEEIVKRLNAEADPNLAAFKIEPDRETIAVTTGVVK